MQKLCVGLSDAGNHDRGSLEPEQEALPLRDVLLWAEIM